MYGQDLQQTDAHLDQLRFLRYRKEVISSWGASEEKKIRLQAIEIQINSLAAFSASRLRQPGAEKDGLR
jgi:hypothetical protein